MERSRERRRRTLASLLSLLALLGLLLLWLLLRSCTSNEGKLASISETKVDISINETPSPTSESGRLRDATPTPSRGRPSLSAEVLGAALAAGSATEVPSATTAPISQRAPSVQTSGRLAMPGLVAPGAHKQGGILVTNTGSEAFHYSVGMTVTGDIEFAQTLKLRVYLRAGASCDYPGPPPSGDDFLPLISGLSLYVGDFATGNKVGDPSVEADPGDLILRPGQSEVLCMEVFFPWGAGDAFQGKSVNGTFTFTAKSPGP